MLSVPNPLSVLLGCACATGWEMGTMGGFDSIVGVSEPNVMG